jgi:hypothetical protein
MQTTERPPEHPRRTPARRPIRKFDPLSFAKDLQTTGFSREQAEGLAARMSAEQSAFIDDRLAHEEDIAVVRTDIEVVRADVEALRLATKADLAETKAEILKWVLSTIAVQTLALLGGMIAITRSVH